MAKATKKKNALDMLGGIPNVKIASDDNRNETESFPTLNEISEKEKPGRMLMSSRSLENQMQQLLNTKNNRQVKGKVTAYVPEDLLAEFRGICKINQVKFSNVLESLIRMYIELNKESNSN